MHHEQALNSDQMADAFLTEYREIRGRLVETRTPGDELEVIHQRLSMLPSENSGLAAKIYSVLAHSESETEQLAVADCIDRLAHVDPAVAVPIWMKLLDRDSIVRGEAWETLMGRGAGEDCLTFRQAAPLIMHYLGQDPMAYIDSDGQWHNEYVPDDIS